MQAVDLAKEQCGDLYNIVSLLTRNKVNHLGKTIDNNKNGVIATLCSRKAKDEIHTDVTPRLCQNW